MSATLCGTLTPPASSPTPAAIDRHRSADPRGADRLPAPFVHHTYDHAVQQAVVEASMATKAH
ncbi:hypothetical protein ABT131_22155 [Streptomyces sp900105245]|uniref:hypothetical protein n=1 Tax=Streptomyces sp. 900105245 TaxID=3154379 RepID=UPI00331C517E